MVNRKQNWFRKSFLYGMAVIVSAGTFSCKDDDSSGDSTIPGVETYQVTVHLNYPGENQPREGVAIKFENSISGVIFEGKTGDQGTAVFEVTAGRYDVSVSETRVIENKVTVFNGVSGGLVVTEDLTVDITLTSSTTSQIIIKELYNGGCQRNDASGAFQRDPYVILYNNSTEPATLENLCFAFVNPFNSNGTNNDYQAGKLFYDEQGWIPAGMAIWTFRNTITLEPGEQIVVAMQNAIDNTLVHSNSINFNNSAYYAMYDTGGGFTNATYYPAPAPAIPVDNYLKAHIFPSALGNAWSLSVSSPAFFIFSTPEGISPADFATNPANNNLYGTNQQRAKVPVNWILDAIEVFVYGAANNQKRLTSAVDAGYVELYNQHGFTLYRNVDKAATEAIAENEGKIVYSYNMGTVGIDVAGATVNGTTDPSGIDAEASMKNGALILYKDTNSSGNDFHQRSKASLRN